MDTVSHFSLLGSQFQELWFIEAEIQEWEVESQWCREFREYSLEFHEISCNIPVNVIILTFQAMLKKIMGNVPRDSIGSLKRFWGMFKKIPRDVQNGYVEFLKRFQRMLLKISGMFDENIQGRDNKDSSECY